MYSFPTEGGYMMTTKYYQNKLPISIYTFDVADEL